MINDSQYFDGMVPTINNKNVYTCNKCGKCKLVDAFPANKEIRKLGWVKKQKIGWVCDECIKKFY